MTAKSDASLHRQGLQVKLSPGQCAKLTELGWQKITALEAAEYVCAFIWDWESFPRRCYQCGELEENHK